MYLIIIIKILVLLFQDYQRLFLVVIDTKLEFLPRIQTERYHEDSNVMKILRKLPYQWFGG